MIVTVDDSDVRGTRSSNSTRETRHSPPAKETSGKGAPTTPEKMQVNCKRNHTQPSGVNKTIQNDFIRMDSSSVACGDALRQATAKAKVNDSKHMRLPMGIALSPNCFQKQ
ncbi:hypothetical protein MPSEU_000181400 [Mayamaea pseudoterrestris]|nr:hypothetical protein MPSEU_000181400 [Mayamaea pseudoterrestris]